MLFLCIDSVPHGTQGQLPGFKLRIAVYLPQLFLPKPQIEINFPVLPTDAGGACVAVI